jgi:hypothetical protein
MVYLGLLIDTIAMTLSVTAERRTAATLKVQAALSKGRVTKTDMQSIIGTCLFISQVIPMGKVFINRLLDALRLSHAKTFVTITCAVRKDLTWWTRTLPTWGGTALLFSLTPSLHLYTDACQWGGGVMLGKEWASFKWEHGELLAAVRVCRQSMPYLELLAGTRAIAYFAHQWTGLTIEWHCDCRSVVDMVNKGITRSPPAAVLLRVIASLALKYNFHVVVTHIPGVLNTVADLLSRNQV